MPVQLIVLDGYRNEVQRDLVSGLDIFSHTQELIHENAWDETYRYRIVSDIDVAAEYTTAEVKKRAGRPK
ncbi:hypothetical protein PQJ75_00480 [Rhodoplanes sp. TEM]|uniref:Uncharacterized protein n=1 Tax=Rhodoplanes tepidamans TaxID=200616 RepID=A0ABT5J519_RHOTP|nr:MULTISPECIES: hypothetical protein [Rhodoplanes]MDC7784727.1 hypothetical protein [Rhodoplanes tepidamans]MDC7982194.1 hypothetical protein [Rhodoplanes sp. TEM]MDQ0356199.1 hypothetical protein [Rhodoplanes tepidamans]